MRMWCEDMGWWRKEYKETTEAKSKRRGQEQKAVPRAKGLGKSHTCLASVGKSSWYGYSPHAF